MSVTTTSTVTGLTISGTTGVSTVALTGVVTHCASKHSIDCDFEYLPCVFFELALAFVSRLDSLVWEGSVGT